MRLRSVAPLGFLDANVDTTLGDYFVPRGTAITLLLRSPSTDGGHFAAPLVFQPERWLGNADGPHDPAAFFPFGSGPRMCPGRTLALIEMNALLSMLYKNFNVERAGASADVTERFGFTMSPIGLKIRLTSRADAAAT
ncbi:MAG: cytochrome P450, partial [Hyphomicrobiales bacterium]|nr:cytochrome P450 [Hyphomicrobiales bacterium]